MECSEGDTSGVLHSHGVSDRFGSLHLGWVPLLYSGSFEKQFFIQYEQYR